MVELLAPLAQLQAWMTEQNIDLALFSVADRFQGEEMQACDRIVQALSGFEGSAGYFIATPHSGVLMVDGRYTVRGRQLADSYGFDLVNLQPGALGETLERMLPEGGCWTACVDVLAYDTLQPLIDRLEGCGGFKPMRDHDVTAWWSQRPEQQMLPLQKASSTLSATKTADKVAAIWQRVQTNHATTGCLVVTDPSEIAWLLNLRGRDTARLTTFRARLVLQKRGQILLFRDGPFDADSLCPELNIEVRPEGDLVDYLQRMQGQVWINGASAPHGLVAAIAVTSRYVAGSPLQLLKAAKDQGEVEGMRQAHLDDAVAMVRFLHWLEENVPSGTVDELSATQQLWAYRAEVGAFAVSFATISAVGANAAMPHYRSTEATNRPLTLDEVYLVDSGGQFDCGTTDITRTLFFGAPSDALVRQNTLVLMGHIDVARARFPNGVTGHQLDSLARQHLWNAGLDFAHGTGHGVGAGLNVHESPPTISARYLGGSKVPFESGMVVSNEPGYYQAGDYGIRIECLQVCQPDLEHDNWLSFDVLTLVPIQRSLIDPDMLSDTQLSWLNSFHERVKEAVLPRLNQQSDGPVIDWLVHACKPLSKSSEGT